MMTRLSRGLGQAVSWLCVLMVLLGSLNALTRFSSKWLGINLNSQAIADGQTYLFAGMVLLGAAWVLAEDRHVRVDVLLERLSPRARAILDIVGGLLFLLPFCVFGVWASRKYVGNSIAVWEGPQNPGGLPQYPLKVLIPTAFVLLGVQGVVEIGRRVWQLRGVGGAGAEE